MKEKLIELIQLMGEDDAGRIERSLDLVLGPEKYVELKENQSIKKPVESSELVEESSEDGYATKTKQRKRKRFEDERKRCTYWLGEEEIRMLDELCKLEEKNVEKKQEQHEIFTAEEESLISRINKKKNQKKTEDTHKRQTFLIQNELVDELEELYKIYGYGFKTEFINSAIRHQINLVKADELHKKNMK